MPDKKTLQRVKRDKKEGKSPSTQAGEFVREEFEHVQEGKHGVKNNKQAIAIGLSKARRAGVAVKAPAKGTVSEKTRKAAKSAAAKAKKKAPASKTRSAASKKGLKKTVGAKKTSVKKSAPAKKKPVKKGTVAKRKPVKKVAARKSVATKKRAVKRKSKKK